MVTVLLLAAAEPPPAVQAPVRLYRSDEAYALALDDCLGLTFGARKEALYVWDPTAEQGDIEDGTTQAIVSWLFNSFSSAPVVLLPVSVAGGEGRLYRIDLTDLGITRASVDRLATLGSGRVPVPEPYLHEVGYRTVEEYWPGGMHNGKEYKAGNYKVKKQVQALSQGSCQEAGLLVAECGSEFPLVRLDWLLYYGLLEPRYHELLAGVDKLETLADYERFAGVNNDESDREADIVRGQVNHSEVALHNRALERRSTRRQHGKGRFWKSLDFASSIRRDDLFADVLNDKVAANELIWSQRNGLQAYGVVDGQGRAGAEQGHRDRLPPGGPAVGETVQAGPFRGWLLHVERAAGDGAAGEGQVTGTCSKCGTKLEPMTDDDGVPQTLMGLPVYWCCKECNRRHSEYEVGERLLEMGN